MSDWANSALSGGNRGILSVGGITPMAETLRAWGLGYSITATTWGSANKAVYQPVLVEEPITVTDMVVTVSTQAGNLDVGVYTWEGTRLVSSGSTAVAAAGNQVVGITDTLLVPGWYNLALACDSSTAAFRGTTAAAGPARVCGVQMQASAFALPSSATYATHATAYAPWIAASYSSTV